MRVGLQIGPDPHPKVPKCKIFDCSDIHDSSLQGGGGDFEVKIKLLTKKLRSSLKYNFKDFWSLRC